MSDKFENQDIRCPKCDSQKAILRIVGLPDWEWFEELQRHYYGVEALPSVIDAFDPPKDFRCEDCGHHWDCDQE